MKNTLLSLVVVASTATVAQAQNVTGDWQGTLNASGVELRVALHVSAGGNGALAATFDSLDQGATGIPVTSISIKDSRLTFSIDAARASYDGRVNADATAIEGTWSQGSPLPLVFRRTAAKPAPVQTPGAPPSDIDGAWQGTLDAGGTLLRLVFHITNTASGLTATLDSLDQGARGIPMTTVSRSGSSLKMESRPIGGAFDGKIDSERATIDGTWSQGGGSLPLLLKRVKD